MRAIEANAASRAVSGASPGVASTAISTSVPSHSSTRRVSYRSSTMRQGFLIDQQQPMNAFGDVTTGKRRSADVADVGVDFHRIARPLSVELRAPRRETDRIAMRFAIGENVERLDGAGGVESDRVGDQFHLADHFVDDE